MNGDEQLTVILGNKKIATISLVDDQFIWQYDQDWQQLGFAVSPHLPLQGNIPPVNVQRFLRNLLPEGNFLDELTNYFHLSKNNTFGLVRALGLDMPGSFVILSTSQQVPKKKIFRKISDQELKQRLQEQEEHSLTIWDGKPRLSVAGVQDKINVILNESGELGFGEGALCSTHLLKFERKKLPHLVLNEYFSMELARSVGIQVANVQLRQYGKYPTLLVERFDRKMVGVNKIKRRHIIDGCQALNLLPDYKYERIFGSGRDVAHIRDGASYQRLFNFANQCKNPILTKQKILDWILFNILIFNYDAHGKNISFFVGRDGISLAPFYDLINIKMYDHFDQEMAMALGDSFESSVVHAYQLADFAESCGLPRDLVSKRLRLLITKLKSAMESSISFGLMDQEETKFVKRYRKMVKERCDYLFQQSAELKSIIL